MVGKMGKKRLDKSTSAIKWFDKYEKSEERTVYTNRELQIPGLRLFAKLHPKDSIGPLVAHYHENAFEFSLITRGSITFHTAGQDITATGGKVHISYPNEVHSTNETPLASMQMYWMQIDISDPSNFFFLKTAVAKKLINSLYSLKTHLVSTDNKEIRHVIESAFRLSPNPTNKLLTASYIIMFLELLVQHAEKPKNIIPSDISVALEYIDNNIENNIRLEQLADISQLSLSQFKQKFSRFIGIPPRQYINRAKITYSEKLLLSNMPITEVAMKLGFNTSSYFSTVFKKYQDCSPKKFIEKHKSQA